MTDLRTRRVPEAWLVPGALLVVYVVWGSTYLAIRFMVAGFPPLLGNALRLLIAGGLFYWFLRRRGAPRPPLREWQNGALVGAIIFVGGLGLVSVAEDVGIGSGVVATAIAMTPVWASLIAGGFGDWPTRREWLGLAIGLAGVVILSREGDFQARPVGFVLVLVAPVFWSFGSVWSRHLRMAPGAIANALQMLGGGAALVLAGVVVGERFSGVPGLSSWLALAYLIGPGSLLAFSSYGYLLRHVRPALATSYGYVNPIVAVALGLWLGGETVNGALWLALPLVVSAVVLIARSPRSPG